MANPFSVQPLGGLQNVQMIGQGMQGIAENVQADRAAEEKAKVQQQFAEAMERNNPQEIAQLAMQYPEIGEAAMGGIKFASEATKSNLRDSMQRVVAGEDPVQVLQDRIQMVQAQGGDPSDSVRELEMAQQDPEAYRQQVESIYAMSFPKEYTAFQKATGQGASGPNIGTYNPRDYTTESFAEFTRTNDPAVLERYTGRTIDVGGVPYREMPDGTLRRLQIPGDQGAEEVTTETVAESEAEITRAGEQAKQDVKAQSPEEQRRLDEEIKSRRRELASAQDVLTRIQSIESNPGFIESITGIRGKIPAIPGTEGFDAEIAFDQLKDTLTLGNLGKMSGVLSESDIRILSSAASGLEYGMSEEALQQRLQEIRSVFEDKTRAEREKISELMSKKPDGNASGISDDEADALINEILGQ